MRKKNKQTQQRFLVQSKANHKHCNTANLSAEIWAREREIFLAIFNFPSFDSQASGIAFYQVSNKLLYCCTTTAASAEGHRGWKKLKKSVSLFFFCESLYCVQLSGINIQLQSSIPLVIKLFCTLDFDSRVQISLKRKSELWIHIVWVSVDSSASLARWWICLLEDFSECRRWFVASPGGS